MHKGGKKCVMILPSVLLMSEPFGSNFDWCFRSLSGQDSLGVLLGLREGCEEDGGAGWRELGWPGSRALSPSFVGPTLLAAPLSGITGNKVELMLMVYDMNSF